MRCAVGFGITSETRWDGGLEAPPYPGDMSERHHVLSVSVKSDEKLVEA